MPIITVISFAILFFLCLSLMRKGTDVFSPGRLFLIVWTFVIGLTELKLSRLQIQWSFYSWYILLTSLLSFLLGIFLVFVIKSNKNIQLFRSFRKTINEAYFNTTLLFRLTLLLFIIYFISYIIIYLMIGYIPLFTNRPYLAKAEWSVFGFGLLIHLAPTIMYLSAIYWFSVKNKFYQKIILGIITLFTFLSFLLLLQRFDIIIAVVMIFIFLYYGTNKIRATSLILVTFASGIFMYFISTIRVSNIFIQYLYYSSRMKFPIKYAVFTEPYMYVVMNLENFANAVEKMSKFSYGAFTFDFLLALVGIKHSLAEYSQNAKFPFLISADYNTYTLFFTFYRDFGIIGVFVFPLILGYIFNSLYYLMRQNPNIYTITLYGLSAFVIIFSFFIPTITLLHFVMNIIVLAIVTKLILIKN